MDRYPRNTPLQLKFLKVVLKKHLTDQFFKCLSVEESSDSFDIRLNIDWKLLFSRFQDLTSIKFTKQANYNLVNHHNDEAFVLLDKDVKKIGVSVSHLSVIYHAGKRHFGGIFFDEIDRGKDVIDESCKI